MFINGSAAGRAASQEDSPANALKKETP